MTTTTFDLTPWLYRLAIIGGITVMVFFLCQQYVIGQINEVQQAWQGEWRDQERSLFTTLQEPGRSLTASPVMQLWLDRCGTEDRRAYEATLERLGSGLSATELQYLSIDFSHCGTTAADQSFAQAIALEREVAKLQQWFRASEFLPRIDDGYYQERLIAWEALRSSMVDLQQAQYELDELQRALIVARQDGAAVDSDRIQTLLENVQAARQSLSDATVSYRSLLRELSL